MKKWTLLSPQFYSLFLSFISKTLSKTHTSIIKHTFPKSCTLLSTPTPVWTLFKPLHLWLYWNRSPRVANRPLLTGKVTGLLKLPCRACGRPAHLPLLASDLPFPWLFLSACPSHLPFPAFPQDDRPPSFPFQPFPQTSLPVNNPITLPAPKLESCSSQEFINQCLRFPPGKIPTAQVSVPTLRETYSRAISICPSL